LGIFGDVRSAVVGSLVGAIVGLIAAALAENPEKETLILTNDDGYAQPMRALLDPMESEEEDISITFEPADLKDVYVCEYARISGFSSREIFFSYLDRYSMCLWMVERSASEYVIKPNLNAGFLSQRDENWFCKCGL